MKVNMNEEIECCPLCGSEVEHNDVYAYNCPTCGRVCIKAWGYDSDR